MAELELRHLRAVRAVAEAGSVSRAATLLGVSQPALTAQLKRIERILGGQLFERGPHGTKPTELGNFVLNRAEALLSDLQALVVSARERGSSGERSVLRVGSIPLTVLGAVLEQLHEQMPELDVQTWVEPSAPVLLKLLSTNRVDLALVERFDGIEPHHLVGLTVRTLVTEPIFVGLADGHPAIGEQGVDLADLADCEWVLPPPHENGVRMRLLAACEAAGFAPKVRHYTSEAVTGRALVKAGCVCMAAAAFRAGGGVSAHPLIGDPIQADLLFAMRANDELLNSADDLFRCAALAYLSVVDANPHFRRWWDAHPEAHADLDAALAEDGLPGLTPPEDR
ncbi:LysR family transcriptional regulator [Kutzneria viridogrisea]|uniref:LysR family transcription regulator n=2 Tax=Kutzneria TaxID=43356 RepID=W5WFC3_9PSEU|nr:LysR family transcriptional regulator [Kutzneria albida]AHH96864.1 LysR family transcription regulator [Kutzneria albida DSM 43870]MBA8927913.1 DNA-binding transcriptional LysR family regulator [Kutzneria viridogrisea]